MDGFYGQAGWLRLSGEPRPGGVRRTSGTQIVTRPTTISPPGTRKPPIPHRRSRLYDPATGQPSATQGPPIRWTKAAGARGKSPLRYSDTDLDDNVLSTANVITAASGGVAGRQSGCLDLPPGSTGIPTSGALRKIPDSSKLQHPTLSPASPRTAPPPQCRPSPLSTRARMCPPWRCAPSFRFNTRSRS